MILATLVDKVRRKLNDWFGGDAAQQVFSDEYYEDAADDALGRLNSDLDTTYTIATLPVALEWVLTLLTTINMCVVFHNYSDVAGGTTGTLKRFEVDGLETEHYEGRNPTPLDYSRMCEALEEQYQDFLDDNAAPEDNDLLPTVTVVTANRPHIDKGYALRSRIMDKGVAAPEITLAQDTGRIIITWSAIYDFQFSKYIIQRKLSTQDWDDDESLIKTLATIYDNHTVRFVDKTATVPATYDYRMVLRNRNKIDRYSTTQSVTVV